MILSFLLTGLTSYILAAIAGSLLYFFIIFIGLIVLNIEILSIFKAISPFWIILLNIIFFITSLVIWLKKGKPFIKAGGYSVKRFLNSFKLDRGLIFLGFGAVFLIVISFILCAFLPVNEPDALSYHTYRALVWAQRGFIHHFQTTDVRNLVMPINSEIIYTWIFSLTGKDFGFGFLEFFSYVFGIAGFLAFFEKFKISYRKRLWAIFIFSSFACTIAQISSTQTDLFTGVLLFYSILFFLDFINKKDNIKGYFSSLSFALALGVKSTAFMAGLVLIILFLIYAVKKQSSKDFMKFILFCGVNFIVFSSYNYILNFIDYQNPFGSKMSLISHGFYGGIKGFIANFITYNLQLLDFSGFMWGIYLSEFIFKVQNFLFNLFQIEQNTGALIRLEGLNSSLAEQNMGYGVCGLLAFIPSVFYSIFLYFKNFKNKIKKKRQILYILGPVFYLNLIVLSFAVGYMSYSIRFIMAFYVISMPVLTFSYFKKNNFYKTIVIIFALFNLLLVSSHLAVRPFKKLMQSYKKEPSFKIFIDNVRCMKYEYFKNERKGCEISRGVLDKIEDYKTVGIFFDKLTPGQPFMLEAKKKHIRADELIFTRLEDYDLQKYDYLVVPYPYQVFEDFNKMDIKKYLENKMPENCYFAHVKDTIKSIVIFKKDDKNTLNKATCGICFSKGFEDKGFKAVNQSKVEWKSYVDDESAVSTYIIYKNVK